MLSSTSCMMKSSQTRAAVFWTNSLTKENISERDAGEKDESDLGMRLVQLRLDVRNAFVELGYRVKENSTTALFSHKNILYQQRRRFMNMYTTSICLACLQPQHTLRCSHSLFCYLLSTISKRCRECRSRAATALRCRRAHLPSI